MITETGPKQFTIVLRIFTLALLTALASYLVYLHFNPPADNPDKYGSILLIMAALLVVLLVISLLQLRCLPFGAIMDDEAKTITVKYFLRPAKVVHHNQMISYNEVTIQSKANPRYGVLLLLSQEKQVLFSDLSLDDYFAVQQFLYSLNVKDTGEQDFSFFVYYLQQ